MTRPPRTVPTRTAHARGRTLVAALAVAGLVGSTLGLAQGATAAAPVDVGEQGPSYAGFTGNTTPTAQKPEHKIWFAYGSWWASMAAGPGKGYHIFQLAADKQWHDTGVPLDNRDDTSADTLFSGGKLFVASHVTAPTSTSGTAGEGGRLYRYSFDASTATWTKDAGFPAVIPMGITKVQSLSIALDSTNKLFAVYTRNNAPYVTTSSSSAFAGAVTFANPFRLNWAGPGTKPAEAVLKNDDTIGVVSAGGVTTVLWSNQTSAKPGNAPGFWAAQHKDTRPAGTWSLTSTGLPSGYQVADNHISMVANPADAGGHVYAVVKTGLNDCSDGVPVTKLGGCTNPAATPPGMTNPLLELLAFTPDTPGKVGGSWTRTTINTVAERGTRPTVVLNGAGTAKVFYAATGNPTATNWDDVKGVIFEKDINLTNLHVGGATAVMVDGTSDSLDDPTTTRDVQGSTTGTVVLASSSAKMRYWSSQQGVPYARPTAKFEYTGSRLTRHFTDLSGNYPTTWAWNFGDGQTSTSANPTHTYAANGDYTVRLTVSNAAGTSTTAQTVKVADMAAPTANFTASAPSRKSFAVQFQDRSTGTVTSWRWKFGDNATSSTRSPLHTYPIAGTYSVTLTAIGPGGTTSKTIRVTVSKVPGAVSHVKAKAKKHRKVKVTFGAAAANGAPIRSYLVKCKAKGAKARSKTVTGHKAVVKGLTPGKRYVCKVYAVNAKGKGPAARSNKFVARR